MSRRVSSGVSFIPILLVALGCVAVPNTTNAQTTVVLDAPDSESIDTTIRGGSYASSNMDGQPLATRAHTSDPFYVRRAILKFDTETRVPKGAQTLVATLVRTIGRIAGG